VIHVLASRIKGTIIASYIKLDCIAQPNLRQICYYYVSYGYAMILIGRTINPEVRYAVVASKTRIFLIDLMADGVGDDKVSSSATMFVCLSVILS